MLAIETLHHVSLPVTDLGRSRLFYAGVLGLVEIERPPFDFEGAWYRVGDRHLHLIVGKHPTLREGKPIIPRHPFRHSRQQLPWRLQHLTEKGYSADAADELLRLRDSPTGRAGFPQIYVLDPDG